MKYNEKYCNWLNISCLQNKDRTVLLRNIKTSIYISHIQCHIVIYITSWFWEEKLQI